MSFSDEATDGENSKKIRNAWALLKELAGPLPGKPKLPKRRKSKQAELDLSAGSFASDAPPTIRGVSTRQVEAEGEAVGKTSASDAVPGSVYPADCWRGGEDRVEIVAYVRWSDWEGTRATWERAREAAAAAEHDDRETLVENMVRDEWLVDGHGFRLAGSGPFIRYHLKGHGCSIGVMNRAEYSGTLPNVKIVIGSIALMERGLEEVWRYLVDYVEGWNGTIDKAIVSRVDYCVDAVGDDVQPYVAKFIQRHWVSRSRRYKAFAEPIEGNEQAEEYHGDGLRMTGFSLGKGIRLTVYDKLLETRHDAAKRAVLINQRWGGEIPEAATRIEFQIRRDYLKEFYDQEAAAEVLRRRLEAAGVKWITSPGQAGHWEELQALALEHGIEFLPGVNSPEDWISLRASVLKYLTDEWFRFTEEKPDTAGRHQNRSATWSKWDKVARSFQAAAGGGAKPMGRTIRKAVDEKQLRAQCRGVLSTLYALSGELPPDENSFRPVMLIRWLVEEITASVGEIDPERLRKSLYARLALQKTRAPLGEADKAA